MPVLLRWRARAAPRTTTTGGAMGEGQDRGPAAAAAALHHIEQAHRELARCVAEGPFERPETLPSKDLLAAYLCLKREHEALRAQYEADMRRWLAFKQWWKEKLREKRRRRSARQAASPSRKTPVKLSPRKAREQILQHRQQVRERMQDNPALFKGLGRYRATSKYAIDADPGLLQNRHQRLLYPPKKSTHAIVSVAAT